jgi:hypothetical protein
LSRIYHPYTIHGDDIYGYSDRTDFLFLPDTSDRGEGQDGEGKDPQDIDDQTSYNQGQLENEREGGFHGIRGTGLR